MTKYAILSELNSISSPTNFWYYLVSKWYGMTSHASQNKGMSSNRTNWFPKRPGQMACLEKENSNIRSSTHLFYVILFCNCVIGSRSEQLHALQISLYKMKTRLCLMREGLSLCGPCLKYVALSHLLLALWIKAITLPTRSRTTLILAFSMVM